MDLRRRLQYSNPVQYRSRWFDGLLMGDDGRAILAGCVYGAALSLMFLAAI
ncbi:MAG: hypothetical protein AAFQ21_00850 [Pseudomonadota bacterium]